MHWTIEEGEKVNKGEAEDSKGKFCRDRIFSRSPIYLLLVGGM